MKKLTALALAVLMLLTLVACNTSTEPSTAGTSPSPVVSPSPDDVTPPTDDGNADEPKKLSVWCWDPAFNIYSMKEAEKVYQETNPNFTLDVIETPWDDLQTKLITAATANALDTLPDIFLCQNNAFQKNVINYPEIFTDLTGKPIAFDQFPDGVKGYSTIDGKLYGVPFDNGAAVHAMRTDYLEQAGYTIADFTDITWADFAEKAKVVKSKVGKPMLSGIAGETDLVLMMLQSAGSSLFNSDGSPNIANNAVLKEALTVYNGLVKDGTLTEINNWDEYIATLVNASVTGTINGCWILGSIQTAADQSGNWNITNLPKLGSAGATNYSANGGSSWAITSNCKDVDLAVDFLAGTFGSSVKFYETILPKAGALANYMPMAQSAVYKEPQEFFGGEAIYAKIIDFAGKVPANNPGVYYYEARDAVGTALTQFIEGTSMDEALKAAEDTVKFQMG